MKKLFFSVFTMLSFIGFSQQNTLGKEYANLLLDPKDFNQLIYQDITFLVVGDNTPTQGLDFELNDDKTKITAGGFLTNGKITTTIEGEFAADDGVYFLNNKKGAQKAKFSANIFFPLNFWFMKSSASYPRIQDSAVTKRAFIKKALIKADTLLSIKRDYIFLYQYLASNGIPVEPMNRLNEEFVDKQIDSDSEVKYSIKADYDLAKYAQIKAGFDKKYQNPIGGTKKRSLEVYDENKEIDSEERLEYAVNLKYSLKTVKLIEDYETAKKKYQKSNELITEIHIKNMASIWNTRSTWFFGISPSFAKESLTLYDEDSSSEDFSNRFDDIKGDLFNIDLSVNFHLQSKKGHYFYGKGMFGLGRGSNIASFTKSTFGASIPSGEYIDDISIMNIESKEAYTGENPYKYGYLKEASLEFYYLYKFIGAFSSIGYEKLEYNESGYLDMERYPWRLGILFNLKSKSEAKSLLVLQLFVNRNNLNLHPKADDDLNFGLSVGLPINIRKNL